jgi:hypothetical protein
MAIRTLLQEIPAVWPAYMAKKTVDKTDPVHLLVTETLPDELKRHLGPYSNLNTDGSTGQGNITHAPWAGVFDPRLTNTPTEGYYIVYLFSVDLKTVTLTIAFGTSQFEKQFGGSKWAFPRMRQAAQRLQDIFQELVPARYSRDPIILGATRRHKQHFGYQQAAIFSLPPYQLDALPTEAVLVADLQETVALYVAISEDPLRPTIDELLIATIPSPAAPETTTAKPFLSRPAPKARKGGKSTGQRRRYSPQSRKVGDAGEQAVKLYETKKLVACGKGHLADKVDHHAAKGEFPGWDLTSYDEKGEKIYIEVKATVGRSISCLDLTANEWLAASHKKHRQRYFIYIVTNALSPNPQIEILQGPCDYVESGELKLEPIVYELDLRKKPSQTA